MKFASEANVEYCEEDCQDDGHEEMEYGIIDSIENVSLG